MNDTTVIDGIGMERILHVIEESLKIDRRYQFFLWAQGALQGVLAHDTLLCLHGDFSTFRFKYDAFSKRHIDPKVIDELIDPVNGPLKHIVHNWLNGDRRPLLYEVADNGSEADQLCGQLRRLGCGHVMAHGAREIFGDEGSFFVFMQVPVTPSSAHAYMLDLVMPHLHMALFRMLPKECEVDGANGAADRALSARELEVLRWVGQGKTNQEIGSLLDISPLTVKNHVQNIFRKLGVSNRAQAVSKGRISNLFSAELEFYRQDRPLSEKS